MVVKHKHLENEIKDILDQISLLVKNETDRVFDFFSETVLDENHLQKLKNILKSLFGTKESEKKLELFLKFSNENKVL